MKIDKINENYEIVVRTVEKFDYITSVDFAKRFGKKHFNVVRTICKIQQDLKRTGNPELPDTGAGIYYMPAQYETKDNKIKECYNMTIDGAILLCMRIKGEKAIKVQLYIKDIFLKHILQRNQQSTFLPPLKKEQGILVSSNSFKKFSVNDYVTQRELDDLIGPENKGKREIISSWCRRITGKEGRDPIRRITVHKDWNIWTYDEDIVERAIKIYYRLEYRRKTREWENICNGI